MLPKSEAAEDIALTEGIEARLARAISPTLATMGYELVRVQVSGTRTPTVQVMADRADGALIGVEDCVEITHALGAVLDVEDPFTGEWSLEVSSAGIDRPLTRTKDWERHAGHAATVELAVPQDGRRRFKGRILGADENEVRLRLDEGGEVTIARPAIRRAKLVLTDELIAATSGAKDDDQGQSDDVVPHSERN